MNAGKLPEGWVGSKLGDVADVNSGIGFPIKYQGKSSGDYPVYKVRDISSAVARNNGNLNIAGHYVSAKEAVELRGKIFRSGTTVFAKIGEAVRLNRRAIIQASGLADNNVMAISAILQEMDKFIFHFMNTIDLSEQARSTTVPSIRKGDVENILLSLPPLAEQKIIAEKLDTLLAQVDSTKARLEQIPQILKRFRQAVLAAAVTGRLTKENKDFRTKKIELDNYNILIPVNWSETILNNVINTQRPLCYGVVQPGDDIKDGIDLIRVCDINDGEVDLNHLRKISKEIDLQYKRSKVRKNDILVTIVGAIGRIGIVRENINVNIARAVARISPECKIIVPMFLHIWLSSPVMQTWLVQSSKEVARKTLNLKDLKDAFVPLPSIEEQGEIVRRVEQLFAYADTIEKQVNNALARVNNLTQSILAKAFRGELTAQWRAENPELISGENSAAALLEKIKAERAANRSKKSSRKKS